MCEVPLLVVKVRWTRHCWFWTICWWLYCKPLILLQRQMDNDQMQVLTSRIDQAFLVENYLLVVVRSKVTNTQTSGIRHHALLFWNHWMARIRCKFKVTYLFALLVADHHYTCCGESPELFALTIVVTGSKSTPGNVLISSLQKCLKRELAPLSGIGQWCTTVEWCLTRESAPSGIAHHCPVLPISAQHCLVLPIIAQCYPSVPRIA